MNNKGKLNKILPFVLAAIIIGIIIYLGPAKAVIIKLGSVSNSSVIKGTNISFTGNLSIEHLERLNINKIELKLSGPVTYICVFDKEGNKISGCEGITIEKLADTSSWGYGYGYGYGYGLMEGILEYNFTLDTSYFALGNYSAQLSVYASGKEYTSTPVSQLFEITSKNVVKTQIIRVYPDEGISTFVNFSLVNSSIELIVNKDTEGNISISLYDELPEGISGYSLIGLGKYIEIEADPNIKNNLSSVIIKVYYNDDEVNSAGLSEDNLRLYYYDNTAKTWEVYDSENGGVNTIENYVWANSTHFSVWGVFQKAIQTAGTIRHTSSGGYAGNAGIGVIPQPQPKNLPNFFDNINSRNNKNYLFDVILKLEDKYIEPKGKVKAIITLKNFGETGTVIGNLFYRIECNGKELIDTSEKVEVNGEKSLFREFKLDLEEKKQVCKLYINYIYGNNQEASSEQEFYVYPKSTNLLIKGLLIIAAVFGIMIIGLVIKRTKK